MYLQHVDIRAQPFQACFYSIEDVFPAQADLIDHFSIVRAHGTDARLCVVRRHTKVAFREDDEFAARDVVFLDRFADDFFREAVGIDVCGLRDTKSGICITTDISRFVLTSQVVIPQSYACFKSGSDLVGKPVNASP